MYHRLQILVLCCEPSTLYTFKCTNQIARNARNHTIPHIQSYDVQLPRARALDINKPHAVYNATGTLCVLSIACSKPLVLYWYQLESSGPAETQGTAMATPDGWSRSAGGGGRRI